MERTVKRTALCMIVAVALGMTGAVSPAYAQTADDVELYRLYNPNSGEHFYTADTAERNSLVTAGWSYESVGWQSPVAGQPVYRLYNPNSGDHHYTTDPWESHDLVVAGWQFEGVAWQSGGDTNVYRDYNPNANTGAHNFTTDMVESTSLVSYGWKDEGVAWQAEENGRSLTAGEEDLQRTLHELGEKIVDGHSLYDTSADTVLDDQTRAALLQAVTDGEALASSSDVSAVQSAVQKIDEASEAVKNSIAANPFNAMIDWAVSIAEDDSHGYSQASRFGNPDYDCSSFVHAALTHAGWNVGPNDARNPFWTGNEFARLRTAGWTRAGGKELTAENGLERGDILFVDNSARQHTEIYIGDGLSVGARGGDKDGRAGDSQDVEISVIPVYDWYTDVYRWNRQNL